MELFYRIFTILNIFSLSEALNLINETPEDPLSPLNKISADKNVSRLDLEVCSPGSQVYCRCKNKVVSCDFSTFTSKKVSKLLLKNDMLYSSPSCNI